MQDGIKADFGKPPLDLESQLAMHRAPGGLLDDGLGAMGEQAEMAPTEILRPVVAKRTFSVWRSSRPLGFGGLLTLYSLRLYFFYWTFGIGWVPEEVIFERSINAKS